MLFRSTQSVGTIGELRGTHGLRELSHDLLCTLQKVPAAKINEHLKRHRGF